MQASRLQAVVLAAFCIAAMGVSASTIDSTMSTDPDDVIDIDPSWLPVGGDALVDAKDEMESNAAPESSTGGGSNGGSGTQPSDDGDRTGSVPERAEGSAVEEMRSAARQEAEGAAERVGAAAGRGTESGSGVLDRLVDLLRQVLVVLTALGFLLLLLVGAHRYGDRLGALFAPDRDPDDERPAWPPEQPDDDVSRAWLAMVLRLEADRPRSRTPEEWASAAVDAGMDPDAVDALTSTFSEVRYGDADTTASRRKRAWANLERVRTAFERGWK